MPHFIAVVVCLFTSCSLLHAATATLPPIVFLTVDDMSWDSVGAYGSPVGDPTPHIDRLAAGATRFRHAFVPVAVCTPSRHVMLSGCYSHTTGTEGFVNITPVAPTLPDILKKHGYYTAIINKGVGNYHWDFQTDRKETHQGRDPSIFADLIRQLHATATKEGKPLFLMANTMDPHRPFHDSPEQKQWPEIAQIIPLLKPASRIYQPTEVPLLPFLPDLPPIRKELAEYYTSVRRADDSIGAIMSTLQELGIADEALMVFISDHGISMPFAKANVYRESLRVPLMVKLPKHPEDSRGRIVADAMVSSVDIAPTLLDLLDLPVPEKMQGRSFAALIPQQTEAEPQVRDHIIGYYFQDTSPSRTPMFTVQDKRFGYIVNLHHGTGKRVGTADYGKSATWQAMNQAAASDPSIQKRIDTFRNRPLEELYDYEADPHALHNLIGDPAHAQVLSRLTAKLESWMSETQCDALEAFRNRADLATRKAYVANEDTEAKGKTAHK